MVDTEYPLTTYIKYLLIPLTTTHPWISIRGFLLSYGSKLFVMQPYPGHLIELGDDDEASVKAIKRRLNIVTSSILDESNPVFGPSTMRTVIDFQKAHSLNPDGVIGSLTWKKLFSDDTVLPAVSQPAVQSRVLRFRAIEVAKSYLWVREQSGHNDGKEVEGFLHNVGLTKGYAWCMAFLYSNFLTAAQQLGTVNPVPMTAGVIDCWNKVPLGLRITVPQAGDQFIMDFGNGAGHTGHVTDITADGYIHTIEGNAQPLTAMVLTPTGFKLMGDLKLGDQIIDPKGEESFVIGIYPKGVRPVYKVSLQDGSETLACDEHLWEITKDGAKNPVVLNTLKIKSDLRHRCRVPLLEPIEYNFKNQLLIDPYLLGLLIGDGSMSKGGSLSFTNIDEKIIEYVENVLPTGIKLKFNGVVGNYRLSTGVTGGTTDGRKGNPENELVGYLRILNLQGKKAEFKFIPEVYKTATIYERLSLLQGLMDSDGTVDSIGRTEFTSCSIQLAKDVQEIIRSLGGRAGLNIKENVFYTSPKQLTRKQALSAFRVQNINMPFFNPFKLERKANRFKLRGAAYQRRIDSIEYVGQQEVQCISVSAKSQLYVTDDFIPTHNTGHDPILGSNSDREGDGVYERSRRIGTFRGFIRYND
jgi:peptidoglycan hydrolase-like protein with peptidoglycan-binding domain